MNKYFGDFHLLKKNSVALVEVDNIYESIFPYTPDEILDLNEKETEFYTDLVHPTNKNVLEIGYGSFRIVRQLLARDCFVDSLVESTSAYNVAKEKASKLQANFRNRLSLMEGEISDYKTDKKYGLIIIPSATLFSLFQDYDKIPSLIHKLKQLLDKGGRLAFDYRMYPLSGKSCKSEFFIRRIKNAMFDCVLFYQEFINCVENRSIANYYLEMNDHKGNTKRYISHTDLLLLDDWMIDKIMECSSLKIFKTDIIHYSDNMSSRFLAFVN